MTRVKYPNELYLLKQSTAFQAAQAGLALTNRDMADGLNVRMPMLKRYRNGLTLFQPDLLYLRSIEDDDIAAFAQAYIKALWFGL